MNTRAKATDIEKFLNKKPEEFSTFAEKIKCARINFRGPKKSIGLSLVNAGKGIGITSVYLWELENEKKKVPNSIIMSKIETFYRFKPGELAQLLVETVKR